MNPKLLDEIKFKIVHTEHKKDIAVTGILMNEFDLERLKAEARRLSPALRYDNRKPYELLSKRIYVSKDLDKGEFKLLI